MKHGKRIVGKFQKAKLGRKWEYATIKLTAPAGWEAFNNYGSGPSLYFDGNKLTVLVRKARRK